MEKHHEFTYKKSAPTIRAYTARNRGRCIGLVLGISFLSAGISLKDTGSKRSESAQVPQAPPYN